MQISCASSCASAGVAPSPAATARPPLIIVVLNLFIGFDLPLLLNMFSVTHRAAIINAFSVHACGDADYCSKYAQSPAATGRISRVPANRTSPATETALKIFNRPMVVIGVVHCPPFPGTPRHRGASVQAICDAALDDARAYAEGGVDALIIENHGDVPFLRPDDIGPETAAFM